MSLNLPILKQWERLSIQNQRSFLVYGTIIFISFIIFSMVFGLCRDSNGCRPISDIAFYIALIIITIRFITMSMKLTWLIYSSNVNEHDCNKASLFFLVKSTVAFMIHIFAFYYYLFNTCYTASMQKTQHSLWLFLFSTLIFTFLQTKFDLEGAATSSILIASIISLMIQCSHDDY